MMPSRLFASGFTVVALGIAAAVLVFAVGTSGEARRGADAARDEGGGVAAACLEGALDCDDTIDVPGGNVADICVEGGSDCDDLPVGDDVVGICVEGEPDCGDQIDEPVSPPSDIGVTDPSGGPVNQVSVDFTSDVTQADLDRVSEIIRTFDPDADVLILERFPPAANALVHHDSPGFCEGMVEQLEAIPVVAGATCQAYVDVPVAPDEPASSEPQGAPGSTGGGDACPRQTPAGCSASPYVVP